LFAPPAKRKGWGFQVEQEEKSAGYDSLTDSCSFFLEIFLINLLRIYSLYRGED
jgi:hypothetical protein